MAKRQGGRGRGGGRAPARRGGGTGRLLLGFVAGLLVAAGGVYWWTQEKAGGRGWTWPSARTGASQQAARERSGAAPLTSEPEQAVPARPKPPAAPVGAPAASDRNGAAGVPGEPVASGGSQPPFGESEEVFETGARVYGAQCASCHGRPGHAVAGAAGQFWTRQGGASVARQPAGVIFREITEGQPERQMPAYRRVLSDSERWDLALLLRNAGGELPDPVLSILRAGR